jgi:DNA-binding transcriptional MerR regulator
MSEPLQNGDGVEELTYPLGAVSRLTGLTPDTLRAWERRYGVVLPLRTPGGTRRYRASDLDRLRLVKAAVDAGHRIGDVAKLGRDELVRITAGPSAASPEVPDAVEAIVDALKRLDAEASERLIALQLAALGPDRFARHVAAPLLERIGDGWASGELCVASEHLASSVLRSLLGASLRPGGSSATGAPIVFGTLPGERHELGLLIAALMASGAGGRVIYLGPDLPVSEWVGAVERARAGAVAVSLVAQADDDALEHLRALRAALPAEVEIWAGGARSAVARRVRGVTVLDSFDAFDQQVRLFGLASGRVGL